VTSEQDELPSSVGLDFQARRGDNRIVSVTKFATGRLVNGSSCDGIDMIIKKLNLEQKIDAMMREFLEYVLETSPCFYERLSLMLLEHKDVIAEFYSPSWWKELSKETSSKILPYGDGSRWKIVKPIARLIAKGKLE
ncbi:hypothetical protein Tco_0942446, partial [Tanacetum coccineum]